MHSIIQPSPVAAFQTISVGGGGVVTLVDSDSGEAPGTFNNILNYTLGVVGDVAVFAFNSSTTAVAVAQSGGETVIAGPNITNGSRRLQIFYRFVDGTEAGAGTSFTGAGFPDGSSYVAALLNYSSGARTALDASATSLNTDIIPSVTATADDLIVGVWSEDTNAAYSGTPTNGFTSQISESAAAAPFTGSTALATRGEGPGATSTSTQSNGATGSRMVATLAFN